MKFNFARLPRMYKCLLLIKLVRLRKFFTLLKDVLKRLGFKIEITNIARNFILLLFLINFFGCLFTVSAAFDITNGDGWILHAEIQDD